MSTLGGALTTGRQATGRSLRSVASAAGMAPSHLAHLEQDRAVTPNPRHLKALADELGLSYVELMRAAGYHMPQPRLGVEPLAGFISNADIGATQVIFRQGTGRVVLIED